MRIGKCTPVLLIIVSFLTLAGCGSGKDHVGGVAGEPLTTGGSAEVVVQPTEKAVIDVWECTSASLDEVAPTTFTPSSFKYEDKVEVTVSSQDDNKETVLFESANYELTLTSNKGELFIGTWQKPNAKSPDEYTLVGHSLIKGATSFFDHYTDTELYTFGVRSHISCSKKSSTEEVEWTPRVEDMKFLCTGNLFGKKSRDRDTAEVEFVHHYDNEKYSGDSDAVPDVTDILFETKDFRIVIDRRNRVLFLRLETSKGVPVAGTSICATAQVLELSTQTTDAEASIKCERTL